MTAMHPMVTVFPELRDDDYAALRDDIAERGQLVPAVTWRSQVIDGRHRAKACAELGVELKADSLPEEWTEQQALDHMMALNRHRRHMDVTERAFAAAEYRKALVAIGRRAMAEAGAKSAPGRPAEGKGLSPVTNPFSRDTENRRETATGKPPERDEADAAYAVSPKKGLTPVPNLSPRPPSEKGLAPGPNLSPSRPFDTRKMAAEALQVGDRSVDRAEAISRAAPELADWVRNGRGTLKLGAQIARSAPDHDQQRAIVEGNPRAPEVRSRLAQLKRQERADAILAQTPGHLNGVDLRLCTVEEMLSDESIEGAALVHADPPWAYNGYIRGAAGNHYGTDDNKKAFVDALNLAYDRAAEHAICLVWVTAPHHSAWARATVEHGLRWAEHTPMYWVKGAFDATGGFRPKVNPGKLGRGAVEILLVYTKGKPILLQQAALVNVHLGPTTGRHSEKPVEWQRQLLQAFTPEGGLVLDLYAGWAPLAQACHQTGRLYVGAEQDPERHKPALAALQEAA